MNLQALCDEAVALHQKGDMAGAEARYRQILDAEPAHFAALHLLGVLRYQQKQYPEALEQIGRALTIDPASPTALSNYGLVLKAMGRLEDALAHYDRALAINPSLAQAWNNRGIALLDLNRLDEALASYDKTLTLNPASAETQGNRGLVLQYLGRLEEARAAYRRSLALDPGRTNVYLDYADAGKIAADDPHLAAMEKLQDAALTDQQRIELNFALAKAHADLGDHQRGFQHLQRGNALKRATSPYDEAATMGYFDRIEAVFTPALLRDKEELGGDPSCAPVFILGMMRSGSTLVEQILASHPAVHGAGELTAFGQLANSSGFYPDNVPAMDAPALHAIGAQYLAELRRPAPTAGRITDKMPANFAFAGLIHLTLPNAAIIHTVRDPVDNCLSCFSKLFTEDQLHTYDLAELGRYYRRYEKLMTHWRAVLPPGRILDVRYEDLVGDLESQARRIVAHCGLPWDARCLSFHTTQRPVRTASFAQVRQPIYKSAVGRALAYEAFLAPLKAALAGD